MMKNEDGDEKSGDAITNDAVFRSVLADPVEWALALSDHPTLSRGLRKSCDQGQVTGHFRGFEESAPGARAGRSFQTVRRQKRRRTCGTGGSPRSSLRFEWIIFHLASF